MGDIPDERQSEFRKYVVEISPKDSDEVLLAKIRWWLEHREERLKRAKIGQVCDNRKDRSDT